MTSKTVRSAGSGPKCKGKPCCSLNTTLFIQFLILVALGAIGLIFAFIFRANSTDYKAPLGFSAFIASILGLAQFVEHYRTWKFVKPTSTEANTLTGPQLDVYRPDENA